MSEHNKSLTDQQRVAYALNMCTVSVSQIIDYNDIYVLEQEYDAILNNLNLEMIPKDEPLLKILKDLLDVITYFRISEGDKKFIEREYQEKMKMAIWSSIPNLSIAVAGGTTISTLIATGVSLASQVGIGYINYRRNKAEYSLQRDKKLWQLKRAAIEQFNFIRKELFDTAWRLADKYQFADSYRLTEKQIKRYNEILKDPDILSRYERLESIKDNFEAYPPFWYFIGNAANYISNDKTIKLSDTSRTEFRRLALEYFDKFEFIDQSSILREDVISASCALEHAEILMLEPHFDTERVKELLTRAAIMSGDDFDVLQLCAVSYIRINEADSAIKILRRLVNEKYNKDVNAQILSTLYVRDRNRKSYELLASRVNPDYLFPMPKDDDIQVNLLEKSFEEKQRDIVKQELLLMMKNFLTKYSIQWNKLLSVFDENVEYPEQYFYDTEYGKRKRNEEAQKTFESLTKKPKYQDRIQNISFELSIKDIINDFYDNLIKFNMFNGTKEQVEAAELLANRIRSKTDDFNTIQKAIREKTFQISDFNHYQAIPLKSFVNDSLNYLYNHAIDQIDDYNASQIAEVGNMIFSFCIKNNIEQPAVALDSKGNPNQDIETDRFDASLFDGTSSYKGKQDHFSTELFGAGAVIDQKNHNFMEEMSTFINDKIQTIPISDPSKVRILSRGDSQFSSYFKDNSFHGDSVVEPHSILIIQDLTYSKHDLIFTTDGLLNIKAGNIRFRTPYHEVELNKNSLKLFSGSYSNNAVDILSLFNLINTLGTKFTRNLEEYVDYISVSLRIDEIKKWFTENPESMEHGMKKVVAIPTKEFMRGIGYPTDEELDPKKNLVQFYSDKDNNVRKLRIIRFERINSQLESIILENDGVLVIR